MGNNLKLTQMAHLHGCSCKLRERDLEKLLDDTGIRQIEYEEILMGPGDDAGAIKISKDFAYLTHLDFFTPIIDDPYLYGQIAVCNAASDVFVKGGISNVGVLVIMASPLDVPVESLHHMLEGIKDFCIKINAKILGGHTIINPWPILGASVTATIPIDKLIRNSTAKPGDILFLTKPLGTQASMSALRALDEASMRDEVTNVTPEKEILAIADFATKLMITPNKLAAEAMLEVKVNASTDITGYGLMGQARLMATRSGVDIEIYSLPIIKGTMKLSSLFGYGLDKGESAETSGGVLISVPKDNRDNLVSALTRRSIPAYEIGIVKKGNGKVVLTSNKKIMEVTRELFL